MRFSLKKGGRSLLPRWSALAEGLLLSVLLQPAPKSADAHEEEGFRHQQADVWQDLKSLSSVSIFTICPNDENYMHPFTMQLPHCADDVFWHSCMRLLLAVIAIRFQSHSATWFLCLGEL